MDAHVNLAILQQDAEEYADALHHYDAAIAIDATLEEASEAAESLREFLKAPSVSATTDDDRSPSSGGAVAIALLPEHGQGLAYVSDS